MTKGMKEGEANGRDVYPDIIDHPHWQSPTRPRMSLYDRSAQFAAFDALTGYTDMVREEQRVTDTQRELDADALEALNRKLSLIADAVESGEHPSITFTVFVPDEHKAGGRYETLTDRVKHVDTTFRKVVLMTAEGYGRVNKTIDFDRIYAIHGALPDWPDSAGD
ncbi:MAG: hypothetical protein J5949_06220 [Oscillospiraceae bacterium]|nr:hypothetical protein [Oscillospiraceae bacterium]